MVCPWPDEGVHAPRCHARLSRPDMRSHLPNCVFPANQETSATSTGASQRDDSLIHLADQGQNLQ